VAPANQCAGNRISDYDNLRNRLIWHKDESTLERFYPEGDASLLTEVKMEYEIL
jgi:hypothetical protein